MLFLAYESFENRNPLPDIEIRNDTTKLIKAVEE